MGSMKLFGHSFQFHGREREEVVVLKTLNPKIVLLVLLLLWVPVNNNNNPFLFCSPSPPSPLFRVCLFFERRRGYLPDEDIFFPPSFFQIE